MINYTLFIVKLVICTNTADFFLSHRRLLGQEAKANGHEVIVLAPKSPLFEKIKDFGFEVQELNMSRKGINPLQELFVVYEFYKTLKRIRPDIYHGFTIKPILYGALVNRVLKFKKTVLSVTGLGSLFLDESKKGLFLRAIVTRLYRFSLNSKNTLAVFQNAEDQKLFLDNKIAKKEQCLIIPGTGVDCDRFQPRTNNDDKAILIFPARFLAHKGFHELIQACDQLEEKSLDFELYLCGKIDLGNPSSITETELKNVSKKNYVTKIQQFSKMEEVYTGHRIVVLPSYREGLSLSLLEACASGLPIVTSDVAGCRETVIEGKNGLLAPVGNFHVLAEALATLISQPELRQSYGEVSRELALNEFDKKKVLAQFMKLYEIGNQ